MSAPAKQGASRWGSFLQQAVAGIEQNLDNILSGEDVPQTHNKAAAPAAAPKEAVPTPPRSSTPSGSSRLQERLAKAVAAKAAAAKNGTQTPSTSNPPSRAGTPSILSASPRPSIDSTATAEVKEEIPTPTPDPATKGKENEVLPTVQVEDTNIDDAPTPKTSTGDATIAALTTNGLLKDKTEDKSPRPSTESITSAAPRQSLGSRQSLQAADSSRPSEDSNARVQQILSDADREEEIHAYIERIDALTAKLQYLAKESADSARKAAAEAGAGTAEKKLAERDEQIALLMEEGQKLSKTELKHMTVIKKLRVGMGEREKEAKVAKERAEMVEKEKIQLAERLKKAEAEGKQATQSQKRLTQIEKDLESVRSENKSKDETIASLKKQLAEAASQATGEEVKKLQRAVNEKQSRINDLEEEVSSEKIERDLLSSKLSAQEKELKSKLEREAERARVAEVELKGEIQALEGRLEIMRSRAEEVSSGATGDAQAKLLRQIETLQSQYAVASENWQGIESSLEARVTTLQRERDEALKKEGETRKKAREMTQKAKASDEETESLHNKITELTTELSQLRTQLEAVQERASEHESALKKAKEDFEREKQSMESQIQQCVEEERTLQRQNSLPPQSPYGNFDKAVSEVASPRRGLTAEFLGLQNIQTSRRPSRGIIDDIPYGDRRISRTGSRANIQGMPSAGFITPKRQDSNLLLSPTDGQAGAGFGGDRMGSIMGGGQSTADPEDYFENVASPADQQNNMDGLGSVSTTAAGPSVQLVDRLSAAVRRLENEKVGTREELSRLASQRDEARSEITNLMKEVEAKRGDRERVGELEKEVEELNKRYEATLEMLGEKSELVEELRADVGDLKGMYRSLAEEYAKLKK